MLHNAHARPSPAYTRAVDNLRDNPGQWQAYNADQHCVVLAGPGSGKTKTLTVKIAKLLIESIRPPRGLACITYNTECARELKTRLEGLGVFATPAVFVGTVHSFCLQKVVMPYATLAGIELPSPLRIALPSEAEMLFARALATEISADEPPWQWRSRAEEYRRTHIDRNLPEWMEDEQVAAVITRYEQLLRQQGLIDFDDMVLMGLKIIEENRWVRRALRAKFPAIVVDEYQDLGVPLHRIVRSLCFRGGSRLFAVGDPDQSIYGFTGARPELLRTLAASARVEAITLPFNYRSGPTIVRASEIALGEERGYQARGAGQGTVDFHERPAGLEDQAEYICTELIPDALRRIPELKLGEIAILYLDKNDGDVIARKAAEHDIPTERIDKGAPYPKTPLTRWLEDCAGWCADGWRAGSPRLSSIIANWASITRAPEGAELERQRVSLVRFLASHREREMSLHTWLDEFGLTYLNSAFATNPALRDDGTVFHALLSAAEPGGVISAWTLAMFASQGGSPDHLNLITLHSAKGLEFRVVVMMGMEQGRVPHWSAGTIQKREQRRLFYVGLTRAKEEVHMTYSGWTRNKYGRRFDNGPSEFLAEVRDRLEAAES